MRAQLRFMMKGMVKRDAQQMKIYNGNSTSKCWMTNIRIFVVIKNQRAALVCCDMISFCAR